MSSPSLASCGFRPPVLFEAPYLQLRGRRRTKVAAAMAGEPPAGRVPSGTENGHLRWSLQGTTALVTGGTRGIGHAVVGELASLGASTYTCSRNAAELARCLAEWESRGIRVTGSVCDVSRREEREELMKKAAYAFDGKLNILINNAGTYIRKPMIECTCEDLSAVTSTNFESGFHLSQLAHPWLSASGRGAVVFVSSVAGLVALFSGSLASATKGALNQLTRNMACEWAKDNIRVNSVAPWYTKTSLTEQVLEDENLRKKIISRIPLRRIAEPGDVAPVVAFLCLPAASYITGQVVPVDGGMTVKGFYPADD